MFRQNHFYTYLIRKIIIVIEARDWLNPGTWMSKPSLALDPDHSLVRMTSVRGIYLTKPGATHNG
jgi:hypothetical protein